MRGEARERILETAGRLFYENGFHATGIDTVVAHSSVNKMTLYKYFPSKQDLMLAVLERRDADWLAWFQQTVAASSPQPALRLAAMFDALDAWFLQEEFKGCVFLKAAAEFSEETHPIHRAAAEHIRQVRDYIEELAEKAGAREAAVLADALNLLLMGAIAIAFSTGQRQIAQQARQAAQTLLAAHGVQTR